MWSVRPFVSPLSGMGGPVDFYFSYKFETLVDPSPGPTSLMSKGKTKPRLTFGEIILL